MRYEHLKMMMKLKDIDVYFVQETWLEGDVFDVIINRYHFFITTEGLAMTTCTSTYTIAALLSTDLIVIIVRCL